MKDHRTFYIANVVAAIVYTALYLLISDEWQEGFPVQLAVYLSVHGIGLFIFALVNAGLRDRKMRNTALKTGLTIFGIGWILIFLFF